MTQLFAPTDPTNTIETQDLSLPAALHADTVQRDFHLVTVSLNKGLSLSVSVSVPSYVSLSCLFRVPSSQMHATSYHHHFLLLLTTASSSIPFSSPTPPTSE